MTPQEETVILEARDILGRYLSQNPVIGSWQALMDYCALTVRGRSQHDQGDPEGLQVSRPDAA